MKISHFFPGTACLLSALALLAPLASAPAATATNDWNITVLDSLLSTVPAGQDWVQISDMQIPVDYLQNWRNRLAGQPQAHATFASSFTTWPGGNVYYAFDASVAATNQKVFLDACAEWATFANLHFIARTSQANYILVTNNPTLNGGLSAVGMAGGAQLLQLGPNAWGRPVICHELGHALGMVHEHQRSDRDSYVTINTNNIISGHLPDFVLLTSSQNKGPYDFLSVMHYSRNAFSVSVSSNTIVPLPAYTSFLNTMGQQFDPVLSTNDRAAMIQVYGAGPGANNIVTNTQDSGPGSLRAALYYAYDHPGTTIQFNIPQTDPGYSNNVFNILPTDAFPSLIKGTTLDATTEPVANNLLGPQILLNGALSRPPSVYSSGLMLKGTNCTVRGLTINNFLNFGILITGANASNNVVTGCYLGVDPTGTSPVTNGLPPLQIEAGATYNTVGGNTPAKRNIISGSAYQGLVIRDSGTTGNTIKGNYIGLNAAGTTALPNAWSGIEIYNAATSNTIGGTNAGEGNTISGNGNYGIAFSQSGVNGNAVLGNYIGLNPAGTAALPNTFAGIGIYGGASSNLIGGFAAGARNVIAGNLNDGIVVSDPATMGNQIIGNYIGVNPSGSSALPNVWSGIDIYNGSTANQVISNLVSGNGNFGVLVRGNFNSIWGNYVGVDATGTTALGNGYAGVSFYTPSLSNTLGGVTANMRNVIAGNKGQGVFFYSSPVTGNQVSGNYIGLNASGTAAVSNNWSGIELYLGCVGNQIGGLGGARNFISGNGNYGVSINNGSSTNYILGNTLGLNATNGGALPNAFDNIVCFGNAVGNQIGGTAPGAANIIAYAKNWGVDINDAGCTNDVIRGNCIFSNVFGGIYLSSTGTGGNHNLAAPTLSSAVVGTNTVINGTYSGTNGVIYQLDFYADTTSSLQGQTFLGTRTVTGTGAAAAFTANLGALLPAGRAVTAIATDPAGNSSRFSSAVTNSMTSTPNDGIPNAWRAYYFGGTGNSTNGTSYAAGDPDNDGLNNLQEFLSGTNPTNAASALRLTEVRGNGVTNTVVLNSANGIVYRVWARNDLLPGAWEILADQVVGTGSAITLIDPAAASLPRRFYRAQVLW